MDKHQEESINFVEKDLLPEAVHNRCFCEVGSREFVEFISAVVEPFNSSKAHDNKTEYYRAKLKINFSGEASIFSLIIKLLDNVNGDNRTYDKFINEEIFYSKITKKYNLDIYPKCYVADMGRYGRPVIVLDDLNACGYRRVDSGKLDEYHLGLCLKAIGRFHQRGSTLKAENFNSFREFYVKLIDIRLDKELLSQDLNPEKSNRILDILRKVSKERKAEIESKRENEEKNVTTICHGRLDLRQSFFFVYENEKPVDVKIIGWNGMRYSSIVSDLEIILKDYFEDNEVLEKVLSVYVEAANK